RTWLASVGDSCSDRLALGAAIGTPAVRINPSAIGCAGILMATVGPPAVTISGTFSFFHRTNVSGPGQKMTASLSALCGHDDVKDFAAAMLSTCTISGLLEGLPLALKMPSTASLSNAF